MATSRLNTVSLSASIRAFHNHGRGFITCAALNRSTSSVVRLQTTPLSTLRVNSPLTLFVNNLSPKQNAPELLSGIMMSPEDVSAEKLLFLVPRLPPTGSHSKETAAPRSNATQGRRLYASSSAEEGEDEDDEEEEEGREEEEEQRPLCSGVLGYPVVRDHSLGVGLSSGAPEASAGDGAQNKDYKGSVSF